MSKGNFFDFGSKLLSSTVQVHLVKDNRSDHSKINQWNLVKGNFEGCEFPITFKQEYGKKLTDILDTGWPCSYLISAKLKDILEKNGFTGWVTFPIQLFDKKSNEIFGYHGFSVVGKCARIDYKKSKIIEKRLIPTGPICQYYQGIEVDEWDGSDFFSPDRNSSIYVTQRVAIALKNNKITNLRLEDVAEEEIDINYVKK